MHIMHHSAHTVCTLLNIFQTLGLWKDAHHDEADMNEMDAGVLDAPVKSDSREEDEDYVSWLFLCE